MSSPSSSSYNMPAMGGGRSAASSTARMGGTKRSRQEMAKTMEGVNDPLATTLASNMSKNNNNNHHHHHPTHNHHPTQRNDDKESESNANDVLDRIVRQSVEAAATATATGPSNMLPDFLPASTWQGSKPGYYFGTKPEQGTGYFRNSITTTTTSTTSSVAARVPPSSLLRNPDEHSNNNSSSNITEGSKVAGKRSVRIAEEHNETRIYEPPPPPPAARLPESDNDNNDNARFLLLEQAEQAAASHMTRVLDLTITGFHHAQVALAKAVASNELQRATHPGQPDMYMDSEVALYEHVAALKAAAADPIQLYPILLGQSNKSTQGDDNSLLSMLVQLLMHENEDIACSVIAVLLEWLDPALLDIEDDETNNDTTPLRQRVAHAMAMLGRAVLRDANELLVANLGRLSQRKANTTSDKYEANGNEVDIEDESDDEVGGGAEDALSVVENLTELEILLQGAVSSNSAQQDEWALVPGVQSVAALFCRDTPLLSWLLEQIEFGNSHTSSVSSLQQRSMEILAVLAPREDIYAVLPNWSHLPRYTSSFDPDDHDKASGTVDGIEILLQAVATFRKKQPIDEGQVEWLENACIIVDAALTYSPHNVRSFVQAQGVELVVRCLKERVHAGGVALKWLAWGAGSDHAYREACEHLIKAGVLKYLFPLMMGRNLPKQAETSITSTSKKASREWNQSIERSTLLILYGLVRQLRDDSPNDAKDRFLAKFVSDPAKCDQLIETLLRYDHKARLAECKFFQTDAEDVLDSEDAVQLAALHAKLEAGGDLLHRLATVIAFCCVHSKRCHERILAQLHKHKTGMNLIRSTLLEFETVLDPVSEARVLVQGLRSALLDE